MNRLFFLIATMLAFNIFFAKSSPKSTYDRTLVVNQINVDSNIPLESEPFENFVKLKPGSTITTKELFELEEKLKNDHSLGNIKIKSKLSEPDQVDLNFNLSCVWTLKEISISGATHYKDELERTYKSNTPDNFHLNTHNKIIEKVKKKLESHGYFNSEIQEDLELNFPNKTVTVKLSIKLPKPVLINSVELEIHGAIDQKLQETKPKIMAKINKLFLGKRYDEQLLEKCQNQIKDLLQSKNCNFSYINFHFDELTGQLKIQIKIELGQLSIINFSESFLGTTDTTKTDNNPLVTEPIIKEIIKQDCIKQGFSKAIVPMPQGKAHSFQPANPMKISSIIVNDPCDPEASPEITLPKLEGQVFSQNLIKKTENLLRNEYIKSGFWDCSLSTKTKIIDSEQVALSFDISRGKQRFLGRTKIVDKSSTDNKRVPLLTKNIIRLKKGSQANPYQIEKYKDQIVSILRDEGFFNSKVDIEHQEKPEVGSKIISSITYKIWPGQKAKFGQITLDNRTKIPEHKIKKHIKFSPGDDWDLSKVKTSLKKIESMGLFKDVRFSCASQFAGSDQIDIPIDLILTEERPREFKAAAGGSIYGIGLNRNTADIDFSCHLGCMCTIKNPFSCADRIQAGFNITHKKQTAELIYQCPEPMHLPVDSKIRSFVGRCGLKDGFIFRQNQSNDFVSRVGTLLSLSSETDKAGSFQLCSGIEAICPPIMDRKNPQNWTSYIVFEPSFCMDKISSNWFNRFGNSFMISSKLIVPVKGDGGFIKTSIKDAIFLPIGSNSCLSLEFGFDQNRSIKNGRYPYTEEKILENGLLKSNLNLFPSLSDRYGLPETDQVAWEILEKGPSKNISVVGQLRLRLLGQLAGVFFQSTQFSRELGLNQASGCGIRYMTPFGMLCVDLSVKWNGDLKISETCSWRVSLGQSF